MPFIGRPTISHLGLDHIFARIPEKPHEIGGKMFRGVGHGLFTLAETETETAADKNGLFSNCVECICGCKTRVCIAAGTMYSCSMNTTQSLVPLTSTWVGWYWVQHFPRIVTAHKLSCGKVMFSQVFYLSTGEGV